MTVYAKVKSPLIRIHVQELECKPSYLQIADTIKITILIKEEEK